MVRVSVKDIRREAILGGRTPPPKLLRDLGPSSSPFCRPYMLLTAQNGCLSSCHRLLGPGSRVETREGCAPPLHRDVPHVSDPVTSRAQRPGSLQKAQRKLRILFPREERESVD